MNMDETPLMWLSSSGNTWEETNKDNVSLQSGATDKHQDTCTHLVSAKGDIPFFYKIVKGKTNICIPSYDLCHMTSSTFTRK